MTALSLLQRFDIPGWVTGLQENRSACQRNLESLKVKGYQLKEETTGDQLAPAGFT